MRHLGHLVRLRLAERGVHRHHADRGVGAGEGAGAFRVRAGGRTGQRLEQQPAGVREVPRIVTNPGDHRPVRGVHHVAHRVHRDERRHHEAVRKAQRGRADPALHRSGETAALPHGSSGAGARVAAPHRVPTRGGGGPVAAVGARTDGPRTLHSEIEQDRGRDDRHPERPHRIADPGLFQESHRSVGGREAERAAPGQDHGVHALHGVLGIEQIRLAGSGSGTPDVNPGNRALPGQDYGAAGGEAVQFVVAHLDAGNRHESGIGGRKDDLPAFGFPRVAAKRDDGPESEEQQGWGSPKEQNGLDSIRRRSRRRRPPAAVRSARDAGAASPDTVRLRRVTSGLCVSGSVGSVADDPGMVTFLPAAAARSPAPRQRAQQPGMRRPAADTAVMAALGDLHAAETLGNHRPGKTGERLQDRLGESVQPAGIGGFRIRCLQLSSLYFHISNIIELLHRTQADTVPTRCRHTNRRPARRPSRRTANRAPRPRPHRSRLRSRSGRGNSFPPRRATGSGQPAPGPSLFVHPKRSPSQNVQSPASGSAPLAPFGASCSQSSVQQCSVR